MERSENSLPDTASHDFEMVKLEDGKTKQNLRAKLSSLWQRKSFKLVFITLLSLVLIFGWIAVATTLAYPHIRQVFVSSESLSLAFENRDLDTAKSELDNIEVELNQAKNRYLLAKPLHYIPLLGAYLKDGERVMLAGLEGVASGKLVIAALEPYADVLGFSGSSEKLEFESAEDRVIFLATTVEKLTPQMDEISASLARMSEELSGINENRYPKSFFGQEIRPKITSTKKTVKSTADSLAQFQPFIELLPDLLGNPDERKYLLLFQNDAELRPTGGFLTAYATMSVAKGKITPGVSEDIYTLDSAFREKVPAPDPIKKYLPLVYNWNLRDMNLSPDFRTSMDTFTKYYKTVPIAPEADAIIAIDTEVPVRILRILGPIGVPGYGGKFSAENDPRCDCPQVIYELENIITRPTYEIREGRKSILGPLMNSMLANMMGSPKTKWAEFFAVFTDSIKEKHLLMYFFDENKQKAVEALGAAGRINSYNGDYLHINDTNFAGAKSNLFVEQEVDQEITMNADGSYRKKLTLTYRNPMPGSNCNLEAGQLCLNGLLRDWLRLYVPEGSKLVSSAGFELEVGTGSDLGHTVFDGFFTLAPQSVKKLEIEYTVPSGIIGEDFRMLIQKQPGTDMVKHNITLNGGKTMVYEINSDTELLLDQ